MLYLLGHTTAQCFRWARINGLTLNDFKTIVHASQLRGTAGAIVLLPHYLLRYELRELSEFAIRTMTSGRCVICHVEDE